MGRVDIITGTLGKALGNGGYTTAKKEISNCYVNVPDLICFQFIGTSNVGASIKVLNY
jgi:7-keto-8-aminopelargonate synthetase-like enzyme